MSGYANVEDRLFDASRAIRIPFESLSRWGHAVNARLRQWRNIRACRLLLDSMSETQLEDLGIGRAASRVRWLDHGEAFPRGECSYHLLADSEARPMALPPAGDSAKFQGNFKV